MVEVKRNGQSSSDAHVSADLYKRLLSHVGSAVVVITTRDAEGRFWGLTATSFCGVSLDPPLILFCLAESAGCHNAFLASQRFSVSVLSGEQIEVAQRCASKNVDKFGSGTFILGETATPLIPGALAQLECRTYATYPGGDHTILVGEVVAGREGMTSGTGQPLLYYERSYGTFAVQPGSAQEAPAPLDKRKQATRRQQKPSARPQTRRKLAQMRPSA